MRLTTKGVLLIALIIGVLGYFALKPRADEPRDSDVGLNTPKTEEPARETQGGGSTTEKASTVDDRRDFNYIAEKPVDGKLRGVVEVGATGFNSFVINMDDERRWEIVSKDFGESLAYEGLATTEDIRAGLKKYISSMFDKGVAKTDMHFVISSGAQKEPKTEIIANELKKMGYVVNLVTPAQEAQLAFRATVPAAFAENSFLVDIGSGNTKVSWQDGGTLRTLELPGAKYYEKGTSDQEVYNDVKEKIAALPEGKRNIGFILGGVPFTLAKQHRANEEERYTVLKNPDDYTAADKKMASGLNIYKGIVDETKTDTFVFDWDSNFTIGFILGLK